MKFMIETMGQVLLLFLMTLVLCGLFGMNLKVLNARGLLNECVCRLELTKEDLREQTLTMLSKEAEKKGYVLKGKKINDDLYVLSLSYEAGVWFLGEKAEGCIEAYIR